jgi:hypothetical protein
MLMPIAGKKLAKEVATKKLSAKSHRVGLTGGASAADSAMAFKIGIISDTHGLLRPEALLRLSGVDHIIHGGDIGDPDIISALRSIAPVTAIRGNVDTDDWAREFPETAHVRLAERSIFVLHDINTLGFDPVAAGINIVVSPCEAMDGSDT